MKTILVTGGSRGIGRATALLAGARGWSRSEEHTSELQSLAYLVCRLLLEKKKQKTKKVTNWGMEMGRPNIPMRNGWPRDAMQSGDVVVVAGSVAEQGAPTGNRWEEHTSEA